MLRLARGSLACAARRGMCTASPTPAEGGATGAAEPTKKKKKKERKPWFDPMTPPPPASEFPAYEPRDFFRYELIYQSKKSRARVGRIHTPHGIIDTPGYVPVATNGALKAISLEQADDLGMQLMFCNSYHLLLQPGPDLIKKAGGLHKFINRDRPIITDSGGFQIFSLSHGSVHDELNMKSRGKNGRNTPGPKDIPKITEEGAVFRSYRDGSKVTLTPELSTLSQKAYGSDIIIPLDELPPYHISREDLEKSNARSHRWMARSLKTHLADVNNQAMYCVVHGNTEYDLRQKSIDYLSSLPFDGFGVGGALGKDRNELNELLKFVMPRLPQDKPNHLLGIADIESIENGVRQGVDTFDSCYPTRIGRHGNLLTDEGTIKLARSRWKEEFETKFIMENTLAEKLGGPRAQGHSLAYLWHLFRAKEPTGGMLATLHNLNYMLRYMERVRERILNDEI